MDDEQWKALLEQVRQQGKTLDSAQRRQSMTQLALSLGAGSGFREELPVSQAGLRAMTVKPRKLGVFQVREILGLVSSTTAHGACMQNRLWRTHF